MRRSALPEYGSAFRNLTDERVHLIRTAGKTDRHYASLWRLTIGSIRDARVGNTWRDHPTPPDTKPRGHLGNWESA